MAAGLALLTQMAIARHLDPHDYGEIASLLTLYTIVGTVGHLGMGSLLIRREAEEPEALNAWARGALRLALVITLLTTAAVVLGVAVLGIEQHYRALLLLPVAYSYTFSELTIARYQLMERMGRVASLQCSPNLLRFSFSSAAIIAIGGPLSVTAALGLASSLAAAFSLFNYRRSLVAGPSQRIGLVRMLAQTWPYGVSLTIYMGYSQGGVLLLRALDTPAAAGSFSLVANVLAAVYLLPFAIFQRLNAKQVARWSAASAAELKPYLQRVVIGSAGAGLLIAIALWTIARPLISGLFGPGYAQAGVVLGIVVFAIPFRFVSTATGGTLTSHADTRLRMRILLAMLGAFIGMSWLASRTLPGVPLASSIAVIFVACEAALCIVYSVVAWSRATRIREPR